LEEIKKKIDKLIK